MKKDLKKSIEIQEEKEIKDFSNGKTEETKEHNNKTKKEKKKLTFMEIVIISILFVSCVNMFSNTSEQSQQSQTTSDSSTQIATEQQYFENIRPFLQQIITERNSMMEILNNADSIEKWKEAMPAAQNCIAFAKEIQNLKATDELILQGGIAELGHRFGLAVERANLHFIQGLEEKNIEQLNHFLHVEDVEVVASINEIIAYIQGGKPIQQQLKEELNGVLNEEEIESINIISGTANATFTIQATETEQEGLLKICEILKIMGAQNKYDYINTSFVIAYPYPEPLFLVSLQVNKQTRQEIDFNTINDNNIIDIAEEYHVVTTDGTIVYQKEKNK